jgi:hypothetical protein
MRVYIIKSNKKIEPFFESVDKVLIKNKELGILQKESFDYLNLTPVFVRGVSEVKDEGEHIIVDNDVFFEPEILNNFIEESRKINNKT